MSDNGMHGDAFKKLGEGGVPEPRAEARQRALAAGRAAFEASQKKTPPIAQGNGWSHRLKSIVSSFKGNKIMDIRLPIGTLAIALLVLPIGYQLYSTTAMTQSGPAPTDARPVSNASSAETPAVSNGALEAVQSEPVPVTELPAAEPATPEQSNELATDELSRQTDLASTVRPPPLPVPAMPSMIPTMPTARQPSLTIAEPTPGSSITQPSGDSFTSFDEQRLKAVANEPVSTFSIDVDTASYSYVRREVEDGYVPEPYSVRIEEMINYFPYDYPAAASAAVPFRPTIGVFPTPWNPRTELLHIGIKGYVPTAQEQKPANLVFLIDTSGSMDEVDKLPLLKRAFGLLVDQLSSDDTVSIVAYAGSAGIVLEPTKASEKAKIIGALDQLNAGGSTAGAEGIELAYRLAEQARVAGGTNRVILATDGDFNVGIDDPQALEDFIRVKRDSGMTLSVLGFGRGNLDDATMQALAQNGNGNASYISSFREAQKVLVEEIGGTLDMIAKDVKIQVEFNPAMVSEYRLIGYETRALNREDFNNDAVDAGDIGAGHTVTAIYEITPAGSGAELIDPLRYGEQTAGGGGDEVAFVRMRYKLPDSAVSQLIEAPVTPDMVYGEIGAASPDMRFAAAVAAFGQKLKGSVYGTAMGWDDIADLARSGRGTDDGGYRAEFISLIGIASLLKPDVTLPSAE